MKKHVGAHPSGHQAKATETAANTECTLTTELDSYQAEGLITGGNQSEICAAE